MVILNVKILSSERPGSLLFKYVCEVHCGILWPDTLDISCHRYIAEISSIQLKH